MHELSRKDEPGTWQTGRLRPRLIPSTCTVSLLLGARFRAGSRPDDILEKTNPGLFQCLAKLGIGAAIRWNLPPVGKVARNVVSVLVSFQRLINRIVKMLAVLSDPHACFTEGNLKPCPDEGRPEKLRTTAQKYRILIMYSAHCLLITALRATFAPGIESLKYLRPGMAGPFRRTKRLTIWFVGRLPWSLGMPMRPPTAWLK